MDSQETAIQKQWDDRDDDWIFQDQVVLIDLS